MRRIAIEMHTSDNENGIRRITRQPQRVFGPMVWPAIHIIALNYPHNPTEIPIVEGTRSRFAPGNEGGSRAAHARFGHRDRTHFFHAAPRRSTCRRCGSSDQEGTEDE